MKLKGIRKITRALSSIALTYFSLLLAIKSSVNAQTKSGVPPEQTKVAVSNEWIRQSLDIHNYLRNLHDSPPLVLNNTISEISQNYANQLLVWALQSLNERGEGRVYFHHNKQALSAGYGENLYYSIMTTTVDPIPPSFAVLLWYEEIKDYDFYNADRKKTSDPDAQIGHLTQLLWKSTTQMGTAYASSKLKNNQTVIFVVANYYPAGNLHLIGNKPKLYLENLLPSNLTQRDVNALIVSTTYKSWWKETEKPLSNTPEEWRQTALNAHNLHRTWHGEQPLRLNEDLCKVSQLWANHLLEGGLFAFNTYGIVHQIQKNHLAFQSKLGENALFYVESNQMPSAENAVLQWYSQSQLYSFEEKTARVPGQRIDDFEQLVWNSTTEFCMSFATNVTYTGQYLTYVVANYYPSKSDLPSDKNRNIFQRINRAKEVNDDEETRTGKGLKILIICAGILGTFVILATSFILLSKFKISLYDSMLKLLRIKRY